MGNNKTRQQTFQFLAERSQDGALELKWEKITCDDISKAFKQAEKTSDTIFDKITKINLWSNNIGDEGLKPLAGKIFQNLAVLWLCNNSISAKGFKYIVDGHLYNLSELYIGRKCEIQAVITLEMKGPGFEQEDIEKRKYCKGITS